ncbi:MAG: hypothetical protein RL328_842, partial [Acidobacteriota bacterium]
MPRLPWLLLALASLSAQTPPAPDPYALVRRAVELDLQTPQFPSDYAFEKRVALTTLDKKGKPTATHVTDSEVIMLLGEQVERITQRDGEPLPPKEAAKEQAGFDRTFARASGLTDQQRQSRTQAAERKDRKRREFLKALPDVYELTLAGTETIDARPAYRIDARPRKGAKLPGLGPQRTFFKLYGSMWVDVETNQWVKVDTVVND